MATPYGLRLREARRYARLTQGELSAKTGIAQSTISTAERLGASSTDTVTYAKACGVSAVWLASGDGPMVGDPGPTTEIDLLSDGALEIAAYYDLIPTSNRIKRVQAYNAATAAIRAVLEPGRPISQPEPDQKKQPV